MVSKIRIVCLIAFCIIVKADSLCPVCNPKPGDSNLHHFHGQPTAHGIWRDYDLGWFGTSRVTWDSDNLYNETHCEAWLFEPFALGNTGTFGITINHVQTKNEQDRVSIYRGRSADPEHLVASYWGQVAYHVLTVTDTEALFIVFTASSEGPACCGTDGYSDCAPCNGFRAYLDAFAPDPDACYASCDPVFGMCTQSSGSPVCSCVEGYELAPGSNTTCEDEDECALGAVCDGDATCTNTAGSFECACNAGFSGDGLECKALCGEAAANSCHELAYCQDSTCVCPEGMIGDGVGVDGCSRESWAVLFSFALRRPFDFSAVCGDKLNTWEASKAEYIALFNQSSLPPGFSTSLHHDVSRWVAGSPSPDDALYLTISALFATQEEAAAARDHLQASLEGPASRRSAPTVLGVQLTPDTYIVEPRVYRWVAKTTSAELQIPPTGFTVDGVHFEPSCKASGCWVVDLTMTAGDKQFNAWYLPHAVGNDAQSFDFDYDVQMDLDYAATATDTFQPRNFPCRTHDYSPDDVALPPEEVTACCLPAFIDLYRPTESFIDQIDDSLRTVCALDGVAAFDPTDPDSLVYNRTDFPTPTNALQGTFKGLTHAEMLFTGTVDPYIGQYTFRLYLDEVETRRMAGMLRGTVGVEHTVDTFIGLAAFKPTGLNFLDPFATQVALHFEKTSFFTVSTHGTNDYTFLEYVNLRLVAVYAEDDNFSGASESGDRTVRTDASDQANYVQVTFTLGSQYIVDPAGSPLIPLDSVRAGHGTFFDGAAMAHSCSEWAGGSFPAAFAPLLTQPCAPAAAMCASPSSIPDSFVVFNIPLGIDYFADAGGPSDTLANNIFVDMVISAAEDTDGTPNMGDDPEQMKTTLTASIPVVEGGINIFCDGFTAKTDLRDVADADIVVGSASSGAELSRLRIMEDIASTQLDATEVTQIDSDSIEAGLMTLVLKGNASYFSESVNTGRREVSIELEDVITIHIMEDSGSGAGSGKDSFVRGLFAMPPADNTLVDGLDTDGYDLNGAFYFTIDRSAQRAHLEPKSELLEECPFNPPRPEGGMPLATCVTRRDVRYREYPWRTGAMSTAMEVCAGGTCASDAGAREAAFFTTMLGDSAYARQLAVDYAAVIAAKYQLNGRYRRAYWINPGYEWTPTQTGGTPLFSVSQKLYLFALITLDEGLATGDDGASLPGGAGPELPSLSRRMLLQGTPSSVGEALQDGESSLGGGVFEFQTSPSQMMAKAFEVPEDRVATFRVKLQLSQAEACMSAPELQASIRATLDDYLSSAASAFHTAQVMGLSKDAAGVQCGRRSVRSLLVALSDATADVVLVVVFRAGPASTVSLASLRTMPAILSVEPLSVSPKVNTQADASYVPPPRPDETDGGSEEGGSKTVLIAGAAAGAAAAVTIAVGVMLFLRRSPATPPPAQLVTAATLQDLKSSLEEDVRGDAVFSHAP